MVQMSIQRRGQRRPCTDQPHSGVTPTMNPSLVAFGLTKPPLKVEIISRQFIERPDKQSREKAEHQFGHVLCERVLLPREPPAQFLKLAATVLLRTVIRVERASNGPHLLHLWPQFLLNILDSLQSTINAGH